VHYPADITAGALLSTLAGLAVWGATLLWQDKFIARFTPASTAAERELEPAA
jgi:membrane-associated phospholipid phosphatase